MAVAIGTTPDFTFDFTDDPAAKDLDLTQMDHVYVTFTSGVKTFDKWDDALTITAKTITVSLSQEDTLKFDRTVEMQANWTFNNHKRGSSDVWEYDMGKQLCKKVLE